MKELDYLDEAFWSHLLRVVCDWNIDDLFKFFIEVDLDSGICETSVEICSNRIFLCEKHFMELIYLGDWLDILP